MTRAPREGSAAPVAGRASERVIGGLDTATLTDLQREVVSELFAVDQARPRVDPDRAPRVRDLIEGRLAPVLEGRDADARRITLGKTQLDALACDGRYLDAEQAGFEWSAPTVRGQLVHRSIRLDDETGRAHPVERLLDHAWEEFRHSGDSAVHYADHVSELEAASVKSEAATVVQEFRAVFPGLPQVWPVVWEPTMTVRFAEGQVAVKGKPDLVLGRPRPQERRMLLLDLKTGNRSRTDRQDMRWYAVLATLKYRQAPFRVGTLYIDEGQWDVEEVTDDVLEAAARGLVDRLTAAIRLTDDPQARSLVAGPYCRWCGLADTCEEKARADAEWAVTSQI